ncbi:hypothetical protein E5288_WYG014654 [Bos mutus]|uniref:Uncharacterized protein n=1 Tax=Bos mutus TaxID=72004 RepID=A0A6B0R021_9CETA|nr:hypothetical protein [Bos mutus]
MNTETRGDPEVPPRQDPSQHDLFIVPKSSQGETEFPLTPANFIRLVCDPEEDDHVENEDILIRVASLGTDGLEHE